MLDRHDLTDEEWARLEPLLPDRTPRRGGRWAGHRVVLNAVFWRARTGSPWRDLPSDYGHWKTVYNRHRRWSDDGTYEQILAELRRDADRPRVRNGRWAWMPGWCELTSTPPVRRIACRPMSTRRLRRAPSRTQGARSNDTKSADKPPAREALGRSRGGLTSKIHLAADSRCRPLSRVTTVGQRHDSQAFEQVMGRIRIGRRGRGRPRTRPGRVLGDKAFSSRTIRSHLRRRRIRTTIAEPAGQKSNRLRCGSKGGRGPRFDAERYKQRNTVERAINKLKNHRAVATRYDKRDYIFRGTIDVVTIRIWLRDPVP